MMKQLSTKEILVQISRLSDKDKNFLLTQILETFQFDFLKIDTIEVEITECVFCHSFKIYKHGIRNKTQRYICNDCKKTFNSRSKTITEYLHHSHYEKFNLFINCFLNLLSMKKSAEICKIAKSTAFYWRHRVLTYLSHTDSPLNKISGKIQMDEVYFNDSNKGTSHLITGKKPRTYGFIPWSNRSRGLSKNQLCFTTALDTKGNIFIEYLGRGKVNSDMLINAYKNKIENSVDSLIVTDADKAYLKFFQTLKLNFKMLRKNNGTSKSHRRMPVILKESDQTYHIQNINNLHQKFKNIIDGTFCGVASKYLMRYLNFVKWLVTNKDEFYKLKMKLVTFLKQTRLDSYLSKSKLRHENILKITDYQK